MNTHPITIDALTRALHTLDLSVRGFAEAVGTDPRTVRRWFSGEVPIPRWVGVTVELMIQNRALSASLTATMKDHAL